MNRWKGKVAVITGASSGIGLATAKAFVCEGLIVVGLARRLQLMEERTSNFEGPGKFYPRKCDITKEQDVLDTFEWIKNTIGTVHILINNAAVLKERSVEESESEELQYIINVNLIGLLYCTRQTMKLMKANQQECHVININSIAGLKTPTLPGRYFGVYSATKFAVRSLSESLTHELLGTKIRICNLSPGYVKTEIFEKAEMDVSFLDKAPALTPENIADSILHVIGAPPNVQITELTINPLGSYF